MVSNAMRKVPLAPHATRTVRLLQPRLALNKAPADPPAPHQPPVGPVGVSDEEVAAVLRQSIACAGRLSRHADVSLAGVCAEHLVDDLRAAGLIVARPVQWRLHP
jgi:hypothetical protein